MNDVEYGLVKIIKGKYKGRFGLYDDDDFGDFDDEELEDEELDDEEEIEARPIVYLGEMLFNSPYVVLNQDEITDEITKEDIENRIGEIIQGLISKSETKERLALYEELVLLQNNYEELDDE